MTANDILDIFQIFILAYGTKFTMPGKETADLWLEIFKNCKLELLKEAVNNCIRKCVFPPVIAEVWQEYETVKVQKEKEIRELQEWWEIAKSIYPDSLCDKLAGQYVYYAILQIESHDERMRYLQHISHEVHKTVDNTEPNELPMLSDLVEKIMWGGENESKG